MQNSHKIAGVSMETKWYFNGNIMDKQWRKYG